MENNWPALPYGEWKETYDTLHMWLQIVGKVKLVLSPPLNEWWHVALSMTPRGLTTGSIAQKGMLFEIRIDFIEHKLSIERSNGETIEFQLRSESVADFYHRFTRALNTMGVDISLPVDPVECDISIPHHADREHRTYNSEQVERLWQVFRNVSVIFERFRTGFAGKASPVQFYWGAFDLGLSRFGGEPCATPEGSNHLLRFSNDEEHYAVGFWPGSGKLLEPAFYAYFVPANETLKQVKIRPEAAHHNEEMGEWILKYEDIRQNSPEESILEFLNTTYSASAIAAQWDRSFLERAVQ